MMLLVHSVPHGRGLGRTTRFDSACVSDIGPIANSRSNFQNPMPEVPQVRIDYSDTHAFTHRIEQEKAAKASGNTSSGNCCIS